MNAPRQLEFAPPDLPLRDDVRRLGALVGDMLAEQVSPAFLEEVERVRTTAIARRQNGGSMESLSALLDGLEPAHAEALELLAVSKSIARVIMPPPTAAAAPPV